MISSTVSRNLPKAFLFILLLVVLLNLVLVTPYLLALFLGWIFATVLKPLHGFLLRKKWGPKWAALCATFVATFMIILPLVGLGFVTVKNLIGLVSSYSKQGVDVDALVARVQGIPFVNQIFSDLGEFRSFLDENSKKGLGHLSDALASFIGAAPESILQLVLALLATYFFLLEGKKFSTWIGPRIPLEPSTRTLLSKRLNAIAFSGFLSMFLASLAQSLVIFAAFIILKVPFAMLAFGVAFVCAWFPIFGVTPVWLAALIYLALADRVGAAAGMGIFGLAAGVVDNFVLAWVMKDRSNIHPLISLVAIFGSIHFFGLTGVLVGPVIAACLIEFLKLWPEFSGQIGMKSEQDDLPPRK